MRLELLTRLTVPVSLISEHNEHRSKTAGVPERQWGKPGPAKGLLDKEHAEHREHSELDLVVATPERLSDIDRESFEERAAIMHFDGGLNLDEAEQKAWQLVTRRKR